MKQGVLKGATTCKLGLCEHYVLGKQTKVSFGTAVHKTKGILEYVHSDIWGPSRKKFLSGSNYFVSIVDNFSRRVWVYTMKSKDEVLSKFVTWKKEMKTKTDRKIKKLRSDNGGEYSSDPFYDICHAEDIARHFIVIKNRTLLEKVQCMLCNVGLNKRFCAEALGYACWLKTPMEAWSSKPAYDYDDLHIFSYPTYYHVKQDKLEPRAKKAIFGALRQV